MRPTSSIGQRKAAVIGLRKRARTGGLSAGRGGHYSEICNPSFTNPEGLGDSKGKGGKSTHDSGRIPNYRKWRKIKAPMHMGREVRTAPCQGSVRRVFG